VRLKIGSLSALSQDETKKRPRFFWDLHMNLYTSVMQVQTDAVCCADNTKQSLTLLGAVLDLTSLLTDHLCASVLCLWVL